MNITIITILLPYPLNSGGAQAQFNMIDYLRHNHNITLVFPENANNSKKAMITLQQMWPEVKFAPYPYAKQLQNIKFFWNKVKRAFNLKFRKNLDSFRKERILHPYGYDLSQRFVQFANQVIRNSSSTLIQIEFYPYLELADQLPPHIKKVFVHHEIRYKRDERMMSEFNITTADQQIMASNKAKEIYFLNRYNLIITLTPTDKNILTSDGVKTTISVSPAGINTPTLPYTPWTGKLVFVGGYNHIPNQEGMTWFINNVLPLVQSSASFEIIGQGWDITAANTRNVSVSCLGFIKHLEEKAYGSIMVVPILSGSGMRMKILEAAALSMPIITTTIGIEGLDFRDRESCLIADTPEAFAASIDLLCHDITLREQLVRNAQAIYIEKYSSRHLAEVRDKIYKQILRT